MIGSRGRQLIKDAEGLRLTAYHDPASGKLTIGYGHVRGVREGQTCTPEDAERWLDEDCHAAEAAIGLLIAVPLTQAMRDALGSWVFNLGYSRLQISTLRRRINAGDYEWAPMELRKWVWGHDPEGRPIQLPGLVTRREREAQLFLEDGLPEGVESTGKEVPHGTSPLDPKA